eukprot:127318-Ditylum_brightwellii.AAC.2
MAMATARGAVTVEKVAAVVIRLVAIAGIEMAQQEQQPREVNPTGTMAVATTISAVMGTEATT